MQLGGVQFGELMVVFCFLLMIWSHWLHQTVTFSTHWGGLQPCVRRLESALLGVRPWSSVGIVEIVKCIWAAVQSFQLKLFSQILSWKLKKVHITNPSTQTKRGRALRHPEGSDRDVCALLNVDLHLFCYNWCIVSGYHVSKKRSSFDCCIQLMFSQTVCVTMSVRDETKFIPHIQLDTITL